MINLNGKNWSDICFDDIEEVLNNDVSESFFLEFKSDGVDNKKIVKEMCAFANSFGGYIIIGVEDDKTITGCVNWNEQRIHALIYDSLTPIPVFDVKELMKDSKQILLIRVNEGINPPYITSEGRIYERVSSGSFPIKDAGKLQILYDKKQRQVNILERKIHIPEIEDKFFNVCGYIDLGFSLNTHSSFPFSRNFYHLNLDSTIDLLKSFKTPYSFSRLANSYVVTIGELQDVNSPGIEVSTPFGVSYFMEMMHDGSVRARIPLYIEPQKTQEMSMIEPCSVLNRFKRIYAEMMGNHLSEYLIYARKYEKLKVLKQFQPVFDPSHYGDHKNGIVLYERNNQHLTKYGKNVIPVGHRIPISGFKTIDRKWFSDINTEYNNTNLIDALFFVEFLNFGFIDPFEPPETE